MAGLVTSNEIISRSQMRCHASSRAAHLAAGDATQRRPCHGATTSGSPWGIIMGGPVPGVRNALSPDKITGMDQSDQTWKAALREYVHLLAESGWFVIVSLVFGEMIPIALFVWALHAAPKPDGAAPALWLTLCACLVGMLVPPFFASMKMRADLLNRIGCKDVKLSQSQSQMTEMERRLDDRRPHLHGEITSAVIEPAAICNITTATLATLRVSITNRGEAASVASHWSVYALQEDGNGIPGVIEVINDIRILDHPKTDSLICPAATIPLVATPSSSVVEKSKTAIQKGHFTDGHLFASFAVLPNDFVARRFSIAIEFADIIGTVTRCSIKADDIVAKDVSDLQKHIESQKSKRDSIIKIRDVLIPEAAEIVRRMREGPGPNGPRFEEYWSEREAEHDGWRRAIQKCLEALDSQSDVRRFLSEKADGIDLNVYHEIVRNNHRQMAGDIEKRCKFLCNEILPKYESLAPG